MEETLFVLAFNTKTIILAEVKIWSSRTQSLDEKQNPQDLIANLNLVKEVRTKVQIRLAIYKQRVVRGFKGRQFQIGDIVLTKAEVVRHILSKLDLKWERPYKMARRTKAWVYQLENQSIKKLPHT